jgi:hypothetical protein
VRLLGRKRGNMLKMSLLPRIILALCLTAILSIGALALPPGAHILTRMETLFHNIHMMD